MGPAGTSVCTELMDGFTELCKFLGVPLALEKSEGPEDRLTFLGIELDSVRQLSRLTEEKVLMLVLLLHSVISCRKITLQQLQSVIGHLNFACWVVAPGRAFLRWLCDVWA